MGININGSNGTTGTNEIETNLTVNKGGEIQHKNMAGTQLPEQSKSIKTLSAFLKSNHTAEINLEQTYKNALKMLNNAKADKNPTDEKVTALNKHIGLYNDALKKEVKNETEAVEKLKEALNPIKNDISEINKEIPKLLELAEQRQKNIQKQIDKSTSFLGHITNFFAKIFNSKNYVDVQQSRKQVDDLKENIKNLKAVQEEFGKQIGKLETTLKDLEKSKNNSNAKTKEKPQTQPKDIEKKIPQTSEKKHTHKNTHKEKPADTLKTATQEKSSKSETITVNGKTHDKTALPKTPEKNSKPKPQEPAADALNEKQVFPANDNAMVTEMKNLKLKHVKEEEMNLYKKGLPKEENTQQVENQEAAANEQQIVPQEPAKTQEKTEQQVNQQVVVNEQQQIVPQEPAVTEKPAENQEVATDKQQVENEQVAADEEQPQQVAADTKQVEQASDKTVPPAPIFEGKAPVPADNSQQPAQTNIQNSALLGAIQSSKGALKHTEQQEKTAELLDWQQAIVSRNKGIKDSSNDDFDYSTLKPITVPTEHQTKKVGLTAKQKANQAEKINKIKEKKAAVAGKDRADFLSEIRNGITLKKTKTEQPATNTQPLKGNNIFASLNEKNSSPNKRRRRRHRRRRMAIRLDFHGDNPWSSSLCIR